jgi:hypothetical protein
MPRGRKTQATTDYEDEQEPKRGGKKIDPIIQGLFDRLPNSGSEWPEADRIQWLSMITQAFKVIYKTESDKSHIVQPDETP